METLEIVKCEEIDEARELLDFWGKLGYTWASGESLSDVIVWKDGFHGNYYYLKENYMVTHSISPTASFRSPLVRFNGTFSEYISPGAAISVEDYL